jgi:hypothetical protein
MTEERRTEREKAAYGPRSLKEPGSPEWCWQTLDALVADYKLIDERFDEVGGALSQLKNVEAWKVIPTDKPYGSLGRMLAMEVGVDSKTIQREIAQARKRRKLGKQGGDRRSLKVRGNKITDQGDNVTLKSRGHSRAYILDRLDRDGLTDLAADVRSGVISANAAAKQMGWKRQPTAFEQIEKLWAKLEPAERKSFCKTRCVR